MNVSYNPTMTFEENSNKNAVSLQLLHIIARKLDLTGTKLVSLFTKMS